MRKPSDQSIAAYLAANVRTGAYLKRVLSGDVQQVDGDALVDDHFNPMIEGLYGQIKREVDPASLTAEDATMFIAELSVFARYNAQFLRRAARSVDGAVPEVAHEFRRNALEEGGERGKLPAHYVLYTSALLKDLGLLVNGHAPCTSTQMLVFLHSVIVESHCPSTILGAYYATEAVAIAETVLLRDITLRYSALEGHGDSLDELPSLKYYYDLHLDLSGEGDTEAGVEIEHQEGIAHFIRDHERYGLLPPQICDGFLQILGAMTEWWLDLASHRQAPAVDRELVAQ